MNYDKAEFSKLLYFSLNDDICFTGCGSLQDREIRAHQVPGDRLTRLYRNIRLGAQTLSQIHGLQVIQRVAAQASPG